ncbi:hypothetical protein [Microtetraspora malaysiensis]|uniref:hypothetical protein n=1 Tax=Microtetraspora malaysiensis TaxID=161358 RepID=UPI00083236EA|nr:hypothetical protein [Microtetraspora malaysiensis]
MTEHEQLDDIRVGKAILKRGLVARSTRPAAGDEADSAEHLPSVSAVVEVGYAAVVRIGINDEQLVNQDTERLGGKARDLRAGRSVEVDSVVHAPRLA